MNIYPKILIVDNEPEELLDISKAFNLACLPCLPMLYTANIPPIEELICSDQVRIIFCDINLTGAILSSQGNDLHTDAAKVAPYIKDALESVAGDGPFYLVFWSKHVGLASNIMEIFRERNKQLSNKIIDFSVMDKALLKNDTISIKTEIEKIIKGNDFLSSIVAIENSVSLAVHEVINELFAEGGQDIAHLKKVFALLANRNVGEKNSKIRPYPALMDALTPLISNKFINYEADYDDLFKSSLKDDLADKKLSLDGNIANRINTVISTSAVYHGDGIPLIRGSFFPVACSELYELVRPELNDSRGLVVTKGDITDLKNHNFMSIINSQFLSKDGWKIKNPEHLDALDKYIKFGIVELAAACDQAQDNRPLYRLALSVLIDKRLSDVKGFSFNIKNNPWKESTYAGCPLIVLEGETYALRVSNKYVFALHEDYSVLDNKPIVRFSEQIVEQILEFNARYSSRRGIYKI